MHVNYEEHTKIVMNNSQLQLFVKVAETGSFTRAGQEMNMTQPAVSRSISSLENDLGVTLIIRDRRNGIMLTEPARNWVVTTPVLAVPAKNIKSVVVVNSPWHKSISKHTQNRISQ